MRYGCVAHHLMIAQPKARSLKAGDQFVVPLCFLHHTELHLSGDERAWWTSHGVDDPVFLALKFYAESPFGEARHGVLT